MAAAMLMVVMEYDTDACDNKRTCVNDMGRSISTSLHITSMSYWKPTSGIRPGSLKMIGDQA